MSAIALGIALSIAGFALLFFGADWMVSGASSIATRLGLSKAFAGLVLVALGTSAPELVVNLIAAANDETDFALANVAGSNLTNICIGFGLIGLVTVFTIPSRHFKVDGVLLVITPLVIVAGLVAGGGEKLPLWTLAPLLALLGVYIVSLLKRRTDGADDDAEPELALPKALALFVIGLVFLFVGGELVFRSAIRIAGAAGMSDALIGFTLVAIGTSIPDVAASVVAARRRENEIAVGNILGSNISNILVVLVGTMLAARTSLDADSFSVEDFSVVAGCSLFMLVLILKVHKLNKWTSALLLPTIVVFLALRVLVGDIQDDDAEPPLGGEAPTAVEDATRPE